MSDDFRSKGGKKAAIVAISANCFLTVLNISVGFICGSSALISEGAHTFSDIITTIVAYIGFHYSQKPADLEHPIGYGRVEALSGLFIVLFLSLIAWEIFEKAIKQIFFNQNLTVPDIHVAIMAIVGIFINFAVSSYIIHIGKQINSPAIVADGQHQRTDIFSSIAVLIGAIVSNMGYPILDPIVSIIIGLLIFRLAVNLFIINFNYLVGKIPSESFIDEIKDIANSVTNSQNAHEVKVDYMGNYAVVSLHIEVDGDLPTKETHKIAHEVQNKILEEKSEVRYVIVHTCPIGLDYDHSQKLVGN
ncbi:cation diffusion facilitator family transporter [Methanobrevibacter sp.]|uniref:cation diffusion facilitator family transporter n=1 Tax=Methanobrevibacter sp. TaxID=66852 RepID=UPI00386D3989